MAKAGTEIFKPILLFKQSLRELRASCGTVRVINGGGLLLTHSCWVIPWHKSNYRAPVASEGNLVFSDHYKIIDMVFLQVKGLYEDW